MFRAGSYFLELLNPSAPYSINRARSFSFFVDTKEDFYDQLLKCCNGSVFLKQIHSSLATAGLIAQRPHLGSQIIIKYAKYGDSHSARSLFDGVHGDGTNSFLWNTMIQAYTNDGQYIETLKLYYLLRKSGISPNNYTFPFVLKACASKSVTLEGRVVHGDAIRTGFDSDRYVEAALADMYARCGQIANARKVFGKMAKRDLVCWTTMITAYEQAMQPLESLLLFQKMQDEGVFSDAVAVVSITSAVGQLGDAMKALVVHAYAITNGFLEDLCVGNSIIAMYGKCGDVEKARLVFDSMEVRDGISWNSLLSV